MDDETSKNAYLSAKYEMERVIKRDCQSQFNKLKSRSVRLQKN